MSKKRRGYGFGLIYILVFLLSLADGLSGYTQSSFLNQFFSLSNVGLIFSVCAAVSIVLSVWLPKAIAKVSLYQAGLSLTVVDIVCALVLAFTHNPLLIFTFFLIRYLGFIFLLIVLDIWLEKISANRITGFIRSIYLTSINLAWLASPLLMGKIVGLNNYGSIYLVGALIMAIFFVILFLKEDRMQPIQANKQRKNIDFAVAFKKLWLNRDLRISVASVVALNIFYTLAVIYLPIHLNQTLGFTWPTIGIMFTFMLLPFVLLPFPAGLMADKFWGEKEMMMAGNVIMAGASAIVFLTTSTDIVFWIILLFFSRVGAALTEGMQEIYFYKKISAKDVELISVFRQARSVGWLFGSIIAFICLRFMAIPGLFLILAGILIFDTIQLSFIKDTNPLK